jgi:hypothetical protein
VSALSLRKGICHESFFCGVTVWKAMAAGGSDTVTAIGESWNYSKNRKLSGKIKTPI